MKNNEQGSVLIYILLGVALFAALSYAVTQSIRLNESATNTSTKEKTSLAYSEIASFLETINQQTVILNTINSIKDTELDYRNNIYKLSNNTANSNNINTNCTVSDCRLFSPYGINGIQPIIFINGIDTATQSNAALPQNGHGQVWQIIMNGVGTTNPDLVFLIHGVTADLCNLYNARNGITTTYTSSTTLTSIGETAASSKPAVFSGTFNTTNQFGEEATSFKGKKSFCAPAYADAETSRLAIWHVIRVR